MTLDWKRFRLKSGINKKYSIAITLQILFTLYLTIIIKKTSISDRNYFVILISIVMHSIFCVVQLNIFFVAWTGQGPHNFNVYLLFIEHIERK